MPGARYHWENRLVSDGSLHAAGVVQADAQGLVVVPAFEVSPGGNRLELRPNQYQLSGGEFQAGGMVQLHLVDADPGAFQWLAVSAPGPGATPVPLLEVVLDLALPILVDVFVADAVGEASLAIPLAPSLQGKAIWLQAFQLGSKSNVLPAVIL